jgi:death-on-curing protein
VSVAYVDLVDYVAIAAEVTGLEVDPLMRVPKLDLADSALHAPAAGFGDVEFYPEFVGKAAVLVVRLAKNHPLPDGNKRAAWVTLRVFIETNGWTWIPPPTVDAAEHAVLAIASASGTRRRRPTGCAHNSTPRANAQGIERAFATAVANFGGSHRHGQHRVVRPSIRSRVLLADPFPACKVVSVGGRSPDPAPISRTTRPYLRPRMSRRTPGECGRKWAQVAKTVTPNGLQMASKPCFRSRQPTQRIQKCQLSRQNPRSPLTDSNR